MADLPDEVEEFLARNVESLEQLEILLLLRSRPDESLDSAEVTRELRLGAGCAEHLASLASRGFLRREEGGAPRYQFAPASGEQARVIGEVARCYSERRVAVIAFIYSPRRDASIRGFANAFRLRQK